MLARVPASILLFLLALFRARADDGGSCWSGGFTSELCCAGEAGNAECWDGVGFTYERCCAGSVGLADAAGGGGQKEDGDDDDEAMRAEAVEGAAVGTVLFNDNLPDAARSIREVLQSHAKFEAGGRSVCRAHGDIAAHAAERAKDLLQLAAELREAREEIIAALRGGAAELPPTPGVDTAYTAYSDILPLCPQAVMQGTLAKLDRMLNHLVTICAEPGLFRTCQANTPFMFDMLFYYIILKNGLIDMYVADLGGPNVTAAYVFRGWPIEEHEDRVWAAFAALWRVIWPPRDYCACVEAYDYYATMHARFEASLHIGRGDFAARLLRNGSEAQRVVEGASYCDEWLNKDFQRMFSSYAKHTACLPGAMMENIVCSSRWLIHGHVIGALNVAELMAKLLSLAGTCLDDERWPFTRSDVEYNFARLALNWEAADVGCSGFDRFGERLTKEPCPSTLQPSVLRRLLWAPSPLQTTKPPRLSPCSATFRKACVIKGKLRVWDGGAGAERRFPLETCSETGRKFHEVSTLTAAELESLQEEDFPGENLIGFVLNLPEFSNVWHDMHWLIPSVARLHGDRRLARRVPHRVVLMKLYDGYRFMEQELEQPSARKEASDDELASRLQAWAVRQAPMLKLITSSPPVLVTRVERLCVGDLVWGHPEMRADRFPMHPDATGTREAARFRRVFHKVHEAALHDLAERFWRQVQHFTPVADPPPPPDSPVTVLVVQRNAAHGRSFLRLEALAAANLDPPARAGEIAWRAVDDLEDRTLLQQAAIFSSAEVVVGAVGAALGWLTLMRPGAQVLEWVPRGVAPSLYRCSEAWNADGLGMFGGLGRLARVDHVCLRSGGDEARETVERAWGGVKTTVRDAFWRQQNLDVDPDKFSRWVREGVRRARRTRGA